MGVISVLKAEALCPVYALLRHALVRSNTVNDMMQKATTITEIT
jgi:hypothetical protein